MYVCMNACIYTCVWTYEKYTHKCTRIYTGVQPHALPEEWNIINSIASKHDIFAYKMQMHVQPYDAICLSIGKPSYANVIRVENGRPQTPHTYAFASAHAAKHWQLSQENFNHPRSPASTLTSCCQPWLTA